MPFYTSDIYIEKCYLYLTHFIYIYIYIEREREREREREVLFIFDPFYFNRKENLSKPCYYLNVTLSKYFQYQKRSLNERCLVQV